MGGQVVSSEGLPDWLVHITDLEDRDEVCMEGFSGLAGGSIPVYATAKRLYYPTLGPPSSWPTPSGMNVCASRLHLSHSIHSPKRGEL